MKRIFALLMTVCLIHNVQAPVDEPIDESGGVMDFFTLDTQKLAKIHYRLKDKISADDEQIAVGDFIRALHTKNHHITLLENIITIQDVVTEQRWSSVYQIDIDPKAKELPNTINVTYYSQVHQTDIHFTIDNRDEYTKRILHTLLKREQVRKQLETEPTKNIFSVKYLQTTGGNRIDNSQQHKLNQQLLKKYDAEIATFQTES